MLYSVKHVEKSRHIGLPGIITNMIYLLLNFSIWHGDRIRTLRSRRISNCQHAIGSKLIRSLLVIRSSETVLSRATRSAKGALRLGLVYPYAYISYSTSTCSPALLPHYHIRVSTQVIYPRACVYTTQTSKVVSDGHVRPLMAKVNRIFCTVSWCQVMSLWYVVVQSIYWKRRFQMGSIILTLHSEK